MNPESMNLYPTLSTATNAAQSASKHALTILPSKSTPPSNSNSNPSIINNPSINPERSLVMNALQLLSRRSTAKPSRRGAVALVVKPGTDQLIMDCAAFGFPTNPSIRYEPIHLVLSSASPFHLHLSSCYFVILLFILFFCFIFNFNSFLNIYTNVLQFYIRSDLIHLGEKLFKDLLRNTIKFFL